MNSTPHADRTPSPNRSSWIVAGLLILGTVIRFARLGRRDFWFDEGCTFLYVQDLFRWSADSSLLRESTNLPYYGILWVWTMVFGHSETSYRSLSALAASLTVPVLFSVAKVLGGRRTGRWTLPLIVLHPLHVYYAQEARAYALWTLLLSLCLWGLIHGCRKRRWRYWFVYGVSGMLALGLHYFSLFWLPLTGAVPIGLAGRAATRRWLSITSGVMLLFIPYFLLAVWPAAVGGGNRWIGQTWSPATAIPESLSVLLPGTDYPSHLRGLSRSSPDTVPLGPAILDGFVEWAPAAATLLILLFLLTGQPRSPDTRSQSPVQPVVLHGVLGLLTIGPLILAWFYSLVYRPIYLVGRYDLVAWPTGVVWLGLTLGQLADRRADRGRRLVAWCLVLYLACSSVLVTRFLTWSPPPSFHHRRADAVAKATQRGDLVLVLSYDRSYLEYYLYRAGFPGRLSSFPSWLDGQVGWVDTESDADPERNELLRDDAELLLGQIAEQLRSGHDVWLLADSLDPQHVGPRAGVNNVLLDALHEAPYRVELRDESTLFYKVLPIEDSG